MRELNFFRGQNLNGAWRRVQWDFSEDVAKAVEGQIRHYLNKILRIEADRRLRADPYESTLERLDHGAGGRRRSMP